MKICTFRLLALLLITTNSHALTIVQPANNSTFYCGQKIKVLVVPSQGEILNGMWIKTTRGSSEILEGPPFEAELKLNDQYVGKEKITAISKINNDSNISETSIDIIVQLPPNVTLEKIETNKSMAMQIAPSGMPLDTERIQVRGKFSDGIRRDLNILSGIQYTSSDPTVATVDSQGLVTALKLGSTLLFIAVGDKTKAVNVRVILDIDLDKELLVKPTDTGIQLDWKLSLQDPEWVTGYMVFRTEDPDGVIKRKIADVPNGTTTYIDTTAAKGKTYYYGVQAISATANERSSMTNMTPGVLP